MNTSRKDKTLLEILGRLESLDGKIDRIPSHDLPTGFGPPRPASTSQPSFLADADKPGSSSSPRLAQQPRPSGTGRGQPYRHASAAHKILAWPAIQQLLLQALPSNIWHWEALEQEGPAFILWIQEGMPKLALDNLQDRPFAAMQSQASRVAGGARTIFPHLTQDTMHQLATAYFDTFNLMYPFMDRQDFISDILMKVHTEGFGGDPDSVIALLVFALGELAIEGSRGDPVEVCRGRPSGVRGGTVPTPPGLAIFNEARKRIGFILTDNSLANVQIYSLAACVISLRSLTI